MFYFTIIEDINQALTKLNLPHIDTINYSDFSDFDYQSNLFFKYFKHPDLKKFQNFIINELVLTNHYVDVKVTGKCFLSLKINPLFQFNKTNHSHKPQKIVIDYCGVNVAKQMHIGHIRSMFIGDYISNHHLYMGDNITRFNHIGDWGNQFGYLIAYILQYHINELSSLTNEDLTNIYKKAYSLYNSNIEFKEVSNNTVLSLYKKDDTIYSIWKKICEISINDLNETTNFFKLGITDKDIKGESFYFESLIQIEKELLSKNIIYIDNGTTIFKSKDGKTLVLKKDNGAYLYPMYDLAAIYLRIKNLNPDKIIYVVDKRQSLYFQQIFEIAQLSQWSSTCEFKHVGFGFITDSNGNPLKTKSGESIYLKDIIKDFKDIIVENNYYDKNEKHFNQLINKEIVNSLKLFDLNFKHSSDYYFSLNNIYTPKGTKWSYLQYTINRIEQLLSKNKVDTYNNSFKNNLKKLNENGILLFTKNEQLKEILILSFNDYQSNVIEEYIFYVCEQFNFFYEKHLIKDLDNKEVYLYLCEDVKDNLIKSMNILGCYI